MTDEVTSLFQGVISKQKIEMQNSINSMKSMMPIFDEWAEINAKIQKKKYDELISAGFTEKQALQLCAK